MGKKIVLSKETRKHQRLKAAFLVKYWTGQGGKDLRITNVKDISAGGMKFMTRDVLKASSLMQLEVMAPALGRSFKAEGKIVRIKEGGRNGINAVAVHFARISDKDQAMLDEFIEHAHVFHGSLNDEERRLFQMMIDIEGVGPTLAIDILAGLSTTQLKKAIMDGSIPVLEQIEGVNKHIAKALLAGLRERVMEDWKSKA